MPIPNFQRWGDMNGYVHVHILVSVTFTFFARECSGNAQGQAIGQHCRLTTTHGRRLPTCSFHRLKSSTPLALDRWALAERNQSPPCHQQTRSLLISYHLGWCLCYSCCFASSSVYTYTDCTSHCSRRSTISYALVEAGGIWTEVGQICAVLVGVSERVWSTTLTCHADYEVDTRNRDYLTWIQQVHVTWCVPVYL